MSWSGIKGDINTSITLPIIPPTRPRAQHLTPSPRAGIKGSIDPHLRNPAMAPPVKLSSTHEMLMNWLLTNPEKSLRECADHFGYTQSWVSQIIHSDLFQHALREKQERVFMRVADGIPAKLRRNADIALEKLSDHLERSEDPEFILSATDKLLHRMGYAPQSARAPAGSPAGVGVGVGVQQNNFFLSQSDLAAARAQLQQGGLALAPQGDQVGSLSADGLVLDGELVAVPEPAPGAQE